VAPAASFPAGTGQVCFARSAIRQPVKSIAVGEALISVMVSASGAPPTGLTSAAITRAGSVPAVPGRGWVSSRVWPVVSSVCQAWL
jgi:hypothetical protein